MSDDDPTITGLNEAVEAADLPEIQTAAQALAVRLLVLDQKARKAKAEYAYACQVAYPVFARLRNADIPQVAPDLGQGRAALFSLLAGAKTIVVDEDELLLLYAVNSPSDLEEFVDPATLKDDRVIKLLKEHLPELVQVRIKGTVRAQINEQIDKRDGWVPTPGTGELVKIAEVTRHQATGTFQLRSDPRADAMISAAIEAGRITDDGALIAPGSEEK